jgi:hypothetical protein
MGMSLKDHSVSELISLLEACDTCDVELAIKQAEASPAPVNKTLPGSLEGMLSCDAKHTLSEEVGEWLRAS